MDTSSSSSSSIIALPGRPQKCIGRLVFLCPASVSFFFLFPNQSPSTGAPEGGSPGLQSRQVGKQHHRRLGGHAPAVLPQGAREVCEQAVRGGARRALMRPSNSTATFAPSPSCFSPSLPLSPPPRGRDAPVGVPRVSRPLPAESISSQEWPTARWRSERLQLGSAPSGKR
jgi:hypothetical protein